MSGNRDLPEGEREELRQRLAELGLDQHGRPLGLADAQQKVIELNPLYLCLFIEFLVLGRRKIPDYSSFGEPGGSMIYTGQEADRLIHLRPHKPEFFANA